MTWRRLGVFVDHLPPESATKSALRDDLGDDELAEVAEAEVPDVFGPWSREALLLADVLDAVRYLTFALVKVNGGTATEPKPYPRPGVRRSARALTRPPSGPGVDRLERTRAEHRARQESAARAAAAKQQQIGGE